MTNHEGDVSKCNTDRTRLCDFVGRKGTKEQQGEYLLEASDDEIRATDA